MTDFNAALALRRLVQNLRAHAEKSGFARVVIGMSGGKDSTVAAAVCARALGKENVLGVLLPDGEQKDIGDALAAVRAVQIPYRVINIGPLHEALAAAVGQAPEEGQFAVPDSKESDINVPPRLRMTVLRRVAQSMNARLICTSNLSEITVGYCTKDGDTSGDVRLLAGLTSKEVVKIGLQMPEIPPELVLKAPADGLSGLTDEENMRLRYDDIHAYIRRGTSGNEETDLSIAARERTSMHKRIPAPVISHKE